MSKFELKIKQYGKALIKKKGTNISDFDDIMDGLKEKFNEKKR